MRWCALAVVFAIICVCVGIAATYGAIVGNLGVTRLLIVLSLTAPATYLAGRAAIRIPRSGVSIGSDAVIIVNPYLTRRVMLDDAAAFLVEDRGDGQNPQPTITLRRKHQVLDVGVWALSRGTFLSSRARATAALQPTAEELNAALERARREAEESGAGANTNAALPATRGRAATLVAVLILSVALVVGWVSWKTSGASHYFIYPWHTAAAFFTMIGVCVALTLVIALWQTSRTRIRRRRGTGGPTDGADRHLGRSQVWADGVEPLRPQPGKIRDRDFKDPFGAT